MFTANTNLIPSSTSSFHALRDANQIYVDKTNLIFELASSREKYFLARPRRFGKTLLTSTFASLFKHGLRDFKGLAIEKLWQDKTYDVVSMDFSEINKFSNFDGFKNDFDRYLCAKFGRLGFVPTKDNSVVIQLSNWLEQLPVNSIVYLIDEYDAPLTACLHDKNLFESVRAVLSQFFNIIKSKDECMRFFFMTGITKFSSTGIFSGFNIFTDISLDVKYGTLLGLTEDEIKSYFYPYLVNASSVLNLPVESILDKLRSNYDGFSFDKKASTHVYSPWSVLKFLKRPDDGFDTYWYSSAGKPSALMNYLISHELSQPASYSSEKWTTLDELKDPREFDDLDPIVLLTQAGYLTIKQIDEDQTVWLGYPNEEVAVSMAKLYAQKLLVNKRLRERDQPAISEIFKKGSAQEVVAVFNKAVSAIDYQHYPIRDEASCRAYIQVLLIGAALIPHIEVHNALGRSDMEISIGSRHWVFEFKYVKTFKDADTKLNEAILQIKNKAYGNTNNAQELIKVALVFCEEKRKFTAFKEVKD